MDTPRALSSPVGSGTPLPRRRLNRAPASSSPFASSTFLPTPTRGGLFAGRQSASSVGGGWQPMDSSTPIPIHIKNFLMSDKKQLERDDSSIELEALYAELEEEIHKIAMDDWMYPKTSYSNYSGCRVEFSTVNVYRQTSNSNYSGCRVEFATVKGTQAV